MRRLALALLVLLVPAVPALAASPSRSQVEAYLLASKSVSKSVKTTIHGHGYGAGIDRMLYGDLTGDGKKDVVVTIFSGGTAGDIAFFVLSNESDGLRTIKASNDEYKVGVQIAHGRLLVTRPIYGPKDPNCCPKHLSITTYRYNGTQLVAASKRRIRTPA